MRFPYYFQLLPSEINLARVFYSIIQEYGWRRVALIVQNELRFKVVRVYIVKSVSLWARRLYIITGDLFVCRQRIS